jgi:hypothetical protein
MNKADIIKSAVNKFISWKLPKDFAPDAGISFVPTTERLWPIGTNLLTAPQAQAMFEHCLSDLLTEVSALTAERDGWKAETERYQDLYLQAVAGRQEFRTECAALRQKVAELERHAEAFEKLRQFAQLCTRRSFDGCDIDGGEAQDLLESWGFLERDKTGKVTPCEQDGCQCSEYQDAGEKCCLLFPTKLLSTPLPTTPQETRE